MKSTLKAVEKEWRMLISEELANLELDLCVRSRRVERRSCGGTLRLRLLGRSTCSQNCSGAATEDSDDEDVAECDKNEAFKKMPLMMEDDSQNVL